MTGLIILCLVRIWRSPAAYISVLSYYLLTSGLFLMVLSLVKDADVMSALLTNMTFILVLIIPFICAVSWTPEKSDSFDSLYIGSQFSSLSIGISKWLGAMSVVSAAIASTVVFPLILSLFGSPQWGLIGTTYFGLFLVAAMGTAIGCWASVVSRSSWAGAGITLAIILGLWLAGPIALFLPGLLGQAVTDAALVHRLFSFERGLISLSDVLYFVVMTVIFLGSQITALSGKRLGSL
ncbi:hypothetical protein EBR96_00155 [bacterium]|nr:hypothetical protein [bacterium]